MQPPAACGSALRRGWRPPLLELSAALHPERLCHGDRHAVHIVAVPDGLKEAVGEAKDQQVLDRLLAEVMIDAEDALFGESRVQRLVQLAGRDQVATERLL